MELAIPHLVPSIKTEMSPAVDYGHQLGWSWIEDADRHTEEATPGPRESNETLRRPRIRDSPGKEALTMNDRDLTLSRHLRETQAADRAPFHMPGHKAGTGAPAAGLEILGRAVYEADVSELGGFDYLHGARTAIADAQAMTAELLGAQRSWFLINGATVGNIAAICATVGDGEQLLVARGSHRSVYAGIWASGAVPVYLPPVRNRELDGLFGVDPDDVRAALSTNPGIRAIHVTTPSMFGLTIPLPEIAAVAAERELPLIVDEAHGTHFAFHPDLPATALSLDADVVVHSPHKALGSLTQSALVHHQGDRVDPHRLDRALQMLQSSSPSAPLLVSLAATLDEMARRGEALWGEAIALAAQARDALAADATLAVYDEALAGSPGIAGLDPAKVVVDVGRSGLTGFAADRWLIAEHGIRAEAADLRRLVFSVTMADTAATIAALIDGLKAFSEHASGQVTESPIISAWPLGNPEMALTPRAAGGAPTESVAIANAAGRVSGEMVVPYPPGIPLLVPGEVVRAEILDALGELRDAGCRIVGMAGADGTTLTCLG